MSNVIPMGRGSIRDFARSTLQIETERSMLDERSASITKAQSDIMAKAMSDCAELSKQQEVILLQRAALDDTMMALIRSVPGAA